METVVKRPKPSYVRHPAKSLLMLLILCGGAYAMYHYRHHFLKGPERKISAEERVAIRDDIVEKFGTEEAFIGIKGHLNWRPKESRYRLDIEVQTGFEEAAGPLCARIAQFIYEKTEKEATVYAFDNANREVGRHVY